MTDAIRGYWVALPSPTRSDGTLNRELFVRHALQLFGQGIDGVVPFGTTGEGPSFSAAERLEGIEALVRSGIDPVRIALGCGFPAVVDTVALAKSALGMGLTHILLLPPFFFRDASPAGVQDAFEAILDGVNDDRMRTTLYHIPQLSGVAVPPEVALRLRERYGRMIAGIKDSSGDFTHFRAFRQAAPELAVTMGSEAYIRRAIEEGGAGTICGLGNIAPALVRWMFDGTAAEGPMQSLVAQFSDRPFEPILKAVLAAQTSDASWLRVRPPLRPAAAVDGERIAAWLSALRVPEAALNVSGSPKQVNTAETRADARSGEASR
jgi:4-hydroxy-tetrahydrodipicolinate synthase